MVILSLHTEREMDGRSIAGKHRGGAGQPDQRDAGHGLPLTRAFGPIPALGNRVLRVLLRPPGNDIVVPATWDRARRYDPEADVQNVQFRPPMPRVTAIRKRRRAGNVIGVEITGVLAAGQ